MNELPQIGETVFWFKPSGKGLSLLECQVVGAFQDVVAVNVVRRWIGVGKHRTFSEVSDFAHVLLSQLHEGPIKEAENVIGKMKFERAAARKAGTAK